MAPPPSVSAHHVIVDSGGFISNAPIKDLAPNVYCIQEVVNEIKDKATKQRLQVNVTCQKLFVKYENIQCIRVSNFVFLGPPLFYQLP